MGITELQEHCAQRGLLEISDGGLSPPPPFSEGPSCPADPVETQRGLGNVILDTFGERPRHLGMLSASRRGKGRHRLLRRGMARAARGVRKGHLQDTLEAENPLAAAA
jgi:hypothetical protein